MTNSLRILLVDDHQMFRDGIRQRLALESDLEVIGEATTGEEALNLVREMGPDVVILDIRLPTISGIETAGRLRNLNKNVRIVLLTGYDYDQYVRAAMKIGVAGYILKDAPQDELVSALREVANGGTVLPPRIATKVVRSYKGATPAPRQPDQLSPREVEILELLAQGLRSADMAQHLDISPRTVEAHLTTIFAKLGAENRNDAVRIALDRNVIH